MPASSSASAADVAEDRLVDRRRSSIEPGVAVDQRDAVEEEAGREGAEQEVLQRRLLAEQPAAAGQPAQQVERQREHLERHEHRQQVVGRREQHHAADREHHQREDLGVLEAPGRRLAARPRCRAARRPGRRTPMTPPSSWRSANSSTLISEKTRSRPQMNTRRAVHGDRALAAMCRGRCRRRCSGRSQPTRTVATRAADQAGQRQHGLDDVAARARARTPRRARRRRRRRRRSAAATACRTRWSGLVELRWPGSLRPPPRSAGDGGLRVVATPTCCERRVDGRVDHVEQRLREEAEQRRSAAAAARAQRPRAPSRSGIAVDSGAGRAGHRALVHQQDVERGQHDAEHRDTAPAHQACRTRRAAPGTRETNGDRPGSDRLTGPATRKMPGQHRRDLLHAAVVAISADAASAGSGSRSTRNSAAVDEPVVEHVERRARPALAGHHEDAQHDEAEVATPTCRRSAGGMSSWPIASSAPYRIEITRQHDHHRGGPLRRLGEQLRGRTGSSRRCRSCRGR